MSNDLECPYCGEWQEANHDDGHGLGEDTLWQETCRSCGKDFTFWTTILFSYDTQKADCLNGSPHNFQWTNTYPQEYAKMQCTICETYKDGKYRGAVEGGGAMSIKTPVYCSGDYLCDADNIAFADFSITMSWERDQIITAINEHADLKAKLAVAVEANRRRNSRSLSRRTDGKFLPIKRQASCMETNARTAQDQGGRMSDRFKFRAWDGKTMWMGWSLHGCNDGSFYGGHFGDVEPPSEEGCPRDGWEWKGADEITLMQCTGLRDANGTLMFEGDVVKVTHTDKPLSDRAKSKEFYCPVVWDAHNGSWRYEYPKNYNIYRCGQHLRLAVVIGNIYENPELLKEAQ